jgi:hypothetical protein
LLEKLPLFTALTFIARLTSFLFEVSDTVLRCSMNERETNLMQLFYIFIVAVGDALHVSGVFAHHQERQKTKPVAQVFCNEKNKQCVMFMHIGVCVYILCVCLFVSIPQWWVLGWV